MGKYARGIVCCVFTLLLCACPILNDNGEDEFDYTDVGTIKTFYAFNLESEFYYSVEAALMAENGQCLVYAENDKGNPSITQGQAERIAREYSRNIEPKITGAFGEILHITDKNKVTFLLLDIKDGYDPKEGGYVAGYFDPLDMEDQLPSNKRDMLYIDTSPGLTAMKGLYSTIAHELQHLINYSNTILKNRNEQDLWINEGLSTAAEYIYGGDPSNRVALYNLDYSDTIIWGNNFFIWDGYWERTTGDVLANYSTAYLFFQWLRLHASNDTGIYREIIDSQYTDYRAVTGAARNRIPALGLTGSAESDWETLLRTWMLANAIQAPSGLFGYRNKISDMTGGEVSSLKIRGLSNTNQLKVTFYPGEGIFTRLDNPPYSPPAGSGANIRYVGFSDNGEIDVSLPYEGQTLLTFNANWDNTAVNAVGIYIGPGESGYLANVLEAAPAGEGSGPARNVRENPKIPEEFLPYRVDAGSLLQKRKWENHSPAETGE
jgi:hypothetical protein